jgi:hypothetical protein
LVLRHRQHIAGQALYELTLRLPADKRLASRCQRLDTFADRPVLKKPFQYPELASALTRLLSEQPSEHGEHGTQSPKKGRDHVTG